MQRAKAMSELPTLGLKAQEINKDELLVHRLLGNYFPKDDLRPDKILLVRGVTNMMWIRVK
jgi:hypothetical protein